jgi:hypothetical protein
MQIKPGWKQMRFPPWFFYYLNGMIKGPCDGFAGGYILNEKSGLCQCVLGIHNPRLEKRNR